MHIKLTTATVGNWLSKWNGGALLIELTKEPTATFFSGTSIEMNVVYLLKFSQPRAT